MTLLNTKDACGYLGITKQSYFRELVANGEIGYKVIGHTKYFPQMELDRWLNELTYTKSIKEEKCIMHTSLSQPRQDIQDFVALLDVKTRNKLKYGA